MRYFLFSWRWALNCRSSCPCPCMALAVPAKATFSAMQSLADPAKAACAGSGDGKSTWMRLSSK